MSLSSNKPIQVRNLGVASWDELPVAASTTIYQSSLVAVDGSGNCVAATDASSRTGVGVACTFADNSAGSAGDVNVKVYTAGEVAIAVSGTVAWGDPLYVASDTQVARSGALTTNGVFIGHCMEAHASLANTYWVRLDGPNKSGYTFPV